VSEPKSRPRRASAPAPRAYHHGDLKNQLVAAALRLFEERGDLDFTFRELARAVGVTHNAPYRHFAGRDELLAALRDEGLARLAAAERRALAKARQGDVRARVRALGEAYVRFALTQPVLFKLVLASPVAAPAEPRRAPSESFALLEGALADGVERGALRGDWAARDLALVAWSLVHGLASLASSGQLPAGRRHLRRYADLVAAVFFDGARA
jgi:AcrR family transcriptional regulator